jgi:hypothetical protein
MMDQHIELLMIYLELVMCCCFRLKQSEEIVVVYVVSVRLNSFSSSTVRKLVHVMSH